jgi:hypothetical protein
MSVHSAMLEREENNFIIVLVVEKKGWRDFGAFDNIQSCVERICHCGFNKFYIELWEEQGIALQLIIHILRFYQMPTLRRYFIQANIQHKMDDELKCNAIFFNYS